MMPIYIFLFALFAGCANTGYQPLYIISEEKAAPEASKVKQTEKDLR